MSCTITVCMLSGFPLLQKICTKMWHMRRYYYTEQRELCLLGDGLPLHILSCVLPEKQAHAGVCIIVMCFTHQHNCAYCVCEGEREHEYPCSRSPMYVTVSRLLL